MIKTIVSEGNVYGLNPTKISKLVSADCGELKHLHIRFDDDGEKEFSVCVSGLTSDDCIKLINFLNNPEQMLFKLSTGKVKYS